MVLAAFEMNRPIVFGEELTQLDERLAREDDADSGRTGEEWLGN